MFELNISAIVCAQFLAFLTCVTIDVRVRSGGEVEAESNKADISASSTTRRNVMMFSGVVCEERCVAAVRVAL